MEQACVKHFSGLKLYLTPRKITALAGRGAETFWRKFSSETNDERFIIVTNGNKHLMCKLLWYCSNFQWDWHICTS